MKSIPETCLAH